MMLFHCGLKTRFHRVFFRIISLIYQWTWTHVSVLLNWFNAILVIEILSNFTNFQRLRNQHTGYTYNLAGDALSSNIVTESRTL